jgi:hypothetical protein
MSARRDGWRTRRGVRSIVAMEVVSGVGDGVFWVGLAVVLLERGAGAAGFALAALARLGPRALLSAPAGALADRVDRRVLLVGLDVARMAAMVALAVAAAAGTDVGTLLALVLVGYVVAAPYRPALNASMGLIAGEDRLVGGERRGQHRAPGDDVRGAGRRRARAEVGDAAVAFGINAASFAVSAASSPASPSSVVARLARLSGAGWAGWGAAPAAPAALAASGWVSSRCSCSGCTQPVVPSSCCTCSWPTSGSTSGRPGSAC